MEEVNIMRDSRVHASAVPPNEDHGNRDYFSTACSKHFINVIDLRVSGQSWSITHRVCVL